MIHHGDCLEILKSFDSDSIDSLVTDPPAGISFMGKEWDKSDGFIPFMTQAMKECLRVLKPGAHGFVWAIPRTSHWTAMALEDAGFEIRDIVTHIFGSGFPKSMNISIAIDKQAGAMGARGRALVSAGKGERADLQDNKGNWTEPNEHDPITAEAKLWQGFGTALKPASEHWILVRKPISEKTVAKNVLKWGCGGLNIDVSRVILQNGEFTRGSDKASKIYGSELNEKPSRGVPNVTSTRGRFPANLVLSHNEDCVEVGVKKVKNTSGSVSGKEDSIPGTNTYGEYDRTSFTKHGSPDGTETVSAFECTPGCAVAELDRQSLAGGIHGAGKARSKQLHKGDFGISEHGERERLADNRFGDSGGASRFFYCAKASKRERNEGLEQAELKRSDYRLGDEEGRNTIRERLHNSIPKANHHPTVKPKKLMSYLITMITPPNGIVLDPFMGSGSTGVAALESGFKFIGIEKEDEYMQIARKRIEYTQCKVD